jgi:type II secretory pathway pseudopilin PulG
MKHPFPRARAFSLVEVVIAIGVFSFAVVAIMGLLMSGLRSNQVSEEEIQAAHLASLLVSVRESSPTNDTVISTNLPHFAIPAAALTNAYTPLYSVTQPAYVGLDGQTTTAAAAAYRLVCSAGTNLVTGPNMAQLYVLLSWPPQAAATNAATEHYELITQIPLR